MQKFRMLVAGFVLGVAATVTLQIFLLPSSVDSVSHLYRVTKVVDGDTIDVVGVDRKTLRVRFVGIDTPETVDPRKDVQCEGREASARLKELLQGNAVTLEQKPDEEKDAYGRLLRYVYLDGRDVGAVMLEEGYAESICKRFPHPKCEEYEALETEAREKKLGRWGKCGG